MFTKAKIKQLIWKAHPLDRFKVSSHTFLSVADIRNSFRFFFDFSMPFIYLGIAIVSLAFLLSYFRARKSFRPPILFIFFSAVLMMFYGMLIASKAKPGIDEFHYKHRYRSGSLLRIKIVEELKHNDYYFKYKGEISAVGEMKTSGNILIRFLRNDKNGIIPLDEGFLTFRDLSILKGPLNPGAFDFQQVMKRKGIYHQLTLDEGQYVRFKTKKSSFKTKALMFRDRILNSLRKKGFSKEEFSVIEALLLGRRQDLSNEIMTNYQNAGAMHLLAISGLHIGILLMILNTLLKPIERFRHGQKIKLAFLILFLWLFAFLSGLSASVTRAVFMFTILSIGLYTQRRNNLGNYLFTALFISLLINPGYIFDLGFQLSYSAVISIIVMSPLIKSLWNPNLQILSYFWNLLAISLSAQIGVLPLSLYYFHQFSALFFLSSLCIIPFLGLILGMGYFMIILNYMDHLPDFYIITYSWVINMMNQTIEILGSLNHLIFRRVFFTSLLLWLSYLLLVFFISWMNIRTVKWVIASLFCGILISTTLLIEKGLTQTSTVFIVFHQYKQSLILNRLGKKGRAYGSTMDENLMNQRVLRDYQLEHFTLEIKETKKMKHFFSIRNMRIMVLDHHAINGDLGFKPDILILMNSPKINLDRLLQELQPKIIVADGSNFFTYKSLWRRTAEKHGILFHDTTKKGAFTLETPA